MWSSAAASSQVTNYSFLNNIFVWENAGLFIVSILFAIVAFIMVSRVLLRSNHRVVILLSNLVRNFKIRLLRRTTIYHATARDDMAGDDKARLPFYDNKNAGIDLTCVENVTLIPGMSTRIMFAQQVNMPPGIYGLVLNRSSTAQMGISLSPGVIDSGYTGQISSFAINMTNTNIRLVRGQRIAQIVIQNQGLADVQFVEVASAEQFPYTHRGTRGFGSSGK
jgi:dUTP pyrophosphatase